MKIYLKQNVLEAGRARIERLFDEFADVVVNFSGGKDSTVVLNLALEVAERRGRLPLPVLWLDQEAEWQHVVDYVRSVMSDPRVRPLWFQGPFRISNATSPSDPWLYCWKEGAEWMREKDPLAIHDNPTGTVTFAQLFDALIASVMPGRRVAHLAGVRAEESPSRLRGLTTYACYKDITWGTKQGEKLGQWTFYPLYDWSYTDIWKAIHEYRWRYCKLYDLMYQYGVAPRNMRVSNVHHETAISVLAFMQEIEPKTWSRVTERLAGINAAGQVPAFFHTPRQLPPMFTSWKEYRDHLLRNLIEDPALRANYQDQFDRWEACFVPEICDLVMKAQIGALVVNDYHGVKCRTFFAGNGRHLVKKGANRR